MEIKQEITPQGEVERKWWREAADNKETVWLAKNTGSFPTDDAYLNTRSTAHWYNAHVYTGVAKQEMDMHNEQRPTSVANITDNDINVVNFVYNVNIVHRHGSHLPGSLMSVSEITDENIVTCTDATVYSHEHSHEMESSEQKSHNCQSLNLDFRKQNQTNEFCTLHSGEKLFTCDDCGLRLIHISDLKIHIKIHTGDDSHQSILCNLDSEKHMKLKKQIHAADKP